MKSRIRPGDNVTYVSDTTVAWSLAPDVQKLGGNSWTLVRRVANDYPTLRRDERYLVVAVMNADTDTDPVMLLLSHDGRVGWTFFYDDYWRAAP